MLKLRNLLNGSIVLKGDYKKLGKRWMQAFLRRNPILKTKRFRNIDSQRVNGATVPVIKSWFQLLVLPQIQAIKPECHGANAKCAVQRLAYITRRIN